MALSLLRLLALLTSCRAQYPPSYKCVKDQDCASVNPEATFDWVFCDHSVDPSGGICHFNDNHQGVPVKRGVQQYPPSYKCVTDPDCASVNPEATFDWVFCDHSVDPSSGICHFNDNHQGVPVQRGAHCPFGCSSQSSTCGTPLPGSLATCCAKDFTDFGGDKGCSTYGCVPEGACTSLDPRCYGEFAKKNAFCVKNMKNESATTLQDDPCDRKYDISGTHSMGDGYDASFTDCSVSGAKCGNLTSGTGAKTGLLFLSMDTQPGIGGGHIYFFHSTDGTAYKFVDGDYGCGYDLYSLDTTSGWMHLGVLKFVSLVIV